VPHCPVWGYETRVFVGRELKNEIGLNILYHVHEASCDERLLGAAVREAVYAPEPQLHADLATAFDRVLELTGCTSERAFASKSTHAVVSLDKGCWTVTPWKRDGRPGWSGVHGGPEHALEDPDDQQLGACILTALEESEQLATWPKG
jgi:hypothetical protein